MKKIKYKILNKIGILKRINIISNITLNHKKFRVPILGRVGLGNLFMSEPWMIDVLKIVIPINNGSFVDVGVNLGQTLLKLKSVSDGLEYIGFEPNPQCIGYVSKLINENNFTNTKLVPVGISNTTELGELKFFSEGETDAAASMIKDFRSTHKIHRREYIPLFDLEKIKKIISINEMSVLKIDVEGAELEVIKSFSKEIIQHKPIIFIEILPIEAYHEDHKIGINRQNEIQKLLKDSGYSFFRVIKENDILITLTEILDIGTHSDLNACEYVMVPEIKKEKFMNNISQIIHVN